MPIQFLNYDIQIVSVPFFFLPLPSFPASLSYLSLSNEFQKVGKIFEINYDIPVYVYLYTVYLFSL